MIFNPPTSTLFASHDRSSGSGSPRRYLERTGFHSCSRCRGNTLSLCLLREKLCSIRRPSEARLNAASTRVRGAIDRIKHPTSVSCCGCFLELCVLLAAPPVTAFTLLGIPADGSRSRRLDKSNSVDGRRSASPSRATPLSASSTGDLQTQLTMNIPWTHDPNQEQHSLNAQQIHQIHQSHHSNDLSQDRRMSFTSVSGQTIFPPPTPGNILNAMLPPTSSGFDMNPSPTGFLDPSALSTGSSAMALDPGEHCAAFLQVGSLTARPDVVRGPSFQRSIQSLFCQLGILRPSVWMGIGE